MLFVAFHFLVLGTLVDQNLGCKEHQGDVDPDTYRFDRDRIDPMIVNPMTIGFKTHDGDVSSYLPYVSFNTIFVEGYEV